MGKSVADLTESLLHRYDGQLPLELVSELVRTVRTEHGLEAGQEVDPGTEAVLVERLERLHRARLPVAREGH